MKLSSASPIAFLESPSRPPERLYLAEVRGPLGTAVLAGTDEAIFACRMDAPLHQVAESLHDEWGAEIRFNGIRFKAVLADLERYLAGEPATFRTAVRPVGLTPFQIAVHRVISRIPRGKVLTYGDIARIIGNPLASRAVGNACRRNRALIIVPCHRVVAANGIGGFGGNVPLKRRLLASEGVRIP